MIKHIPHIHLFELYGSKYLYDVNTNGVMGISGDVWNYLSQLLALQIDAGQERSALYEALCPEGKDDIAFLVSQGFLQEERRYVTIRHEETNRLETMYKSNLNVITLQVTQNCNLRCKYCVYSGSYVNRIHNNKRMSLETAIRSIDFLHDRSQNSESVSIGFYGGEPLLEFDLIKECVIHAKQLFAGKVLNFFMTSNATLLDEEKIRFLEKYQFNLTISLDGPRDIQNKNRIFAGSNKGTYDTIMEKLELVQSVCPDFMKHIAFNAVIDLHNDVSCTSEYFMSYDLVKEIGVSGNFVDVNNRKQETAALMPPDFMVKSKYEIFKIYLNSCTDLLQGYKTSLYSFQLLYINNQIAERTVINNHESTIDCPGGQCLPGIQRLFVNTDGDLFPCERVNESAEVFCIGNIYDGFHLDRARALLNVAQLTQDECKHCWCYKLCEQCCGRAEKDGKLDRDKRLSLCRGIAHTTEESFKNYIVLKRYKSRLL